MPSLAARLTAIERVTPEKRVIFFGWMREEGTEITKVSSGEEKWTRQESETEQQFLGRVGKELEVSGPYPRFGIVS